MNDDTQLREAITSELTRSFDDRGFRRFVRALGSPDLGPSLLNSGTTEEVIFHGVEVLGRQGRLDKNFFLTWQERRPFKHLEIAALARQKGYDVPDVSAFSQTISRNTRISTALVAIALAGAASAFITYGTYGTPPSEDPITVDEENSPAITSSNNPSAPIGVSRQRPDPPTAPINVDEVDSPPITSSNSPSAPIGVSRPQQPDPPTAPINDPSPSRDSMRRINRIEYNSLFPAFWSCKFRGLSYGVAQIVAYPTDTIKFYLADEGDAWITSGYGAVKWEHHREVMVLVPEI